MKTYDNTKPLLSIHMPKCGGTSLRATLKEWFGTELYLHYYDERKGIMPQRHKLKKWYSNNYLRNICIHGHFNSKRDFGVDDYYPELDQAITFIRDPLEIALSVFFYNKKLEREGRNFRDGKKMEVAQNVDEFLENTNSYIKYFLPQRMSSDNIEDFFANYFVHVGVMEHYQKSIDILSEKLNKPKIKISHQNISERLQNPSQSSIRKFKERCHLEYMFYNMALEKNGVG